MVRTVPQWNQGGGGEALEGEVAVGPLLLTAKEPLVAVALGFVQQ